MTIVIFANTRQEVVQEFVDYMRKQAERFRERPARTKVDRERFDAIAIRYEQDADWFDGAEVRDTQ